MCLYGHTFLKNVESKIFHPVKTIDYIPSPPPSHFLMGQVVVQWHKHLGRSIQDSWQSWWWWRAGPWEDRAEVEPWLWENHHPFPGKLMTVPLPYWPKTPLHFYPPISTTSQPHAKWEVDLRGNMLMFLHSLVIDLLMKLTLLMLISRLVIEFGNWLWETEWKKNPTCGSEKGVFIPQWHREIEASLWEILPFIWTIKLHVADWAVINNHSKCNWLPTRIY